MLALGWRDKDSALRQTKDFLRRYVKEISTNYVLGREKVCNFNFWRAEIAYRGLQGLANAKVEFTVHTACSFQVRAVHLEND